MMASSGAPSDRHSPEPGSVVAQSAADALHGSEAGPVAVDQQILTWLTMAALNDICAADGDIGCCPVCWAPCAAVKALLDAGQLDAAVRERGPGWDWWDDANNRVDRGLLERAWRLTGCHGDTQAPLSLTRHR